MAEEGHHGGSGVDGESVLQGGEVCDLKCREELIPEVSVNVTIFVVLLTRFSVLAEERLLVEGCCPRQDMGCATGVSQADERVSEDEDVLGRRQDKTKLAFLAPSTGTLN